MKSSDINKAVFVVFDRNMRGNDFWEKVGFIVRYDLIYRNISLMDIVKINK